MIKLGVKYERYSSVDCPRPSCLTKTHGAVSAVDRFVDSAVAAGRLRSSGGLAVGVQINRREPGAKCCVSR